MIFKIDKVMTSFGFKENVVDQCVYLKNSGRIIVLYVDDIWLPVMILGYYMKKQTLSKALKMNDLG